GEFTGGERTTPANVGETEVARTPNGTIKGLIGVEGAVGVFISDAAESTVTNKITSTETFTNGYVGGFVAAPSDIATGNTDVAFSDWTRDTARSATLNTGTRANEFLAGGATGLRTTGAINLPTQENALRGIISRADCAAINARFAGETKTITTVGTYTVTNNNHPVDDTSVVNTLETETESAPFPTRDCTLTDTGSLNLATATFGDSENEDGDTLDNRLSKVAIGGVAYFQDGDQFYAGLLSGTDLGAPITDASHVGMWRGNFQAIGANSVNTEFMLEVTFGGAGDVVGAINALVQHENTSYYLLAGTYDANGIITGTVDYDTFTGTAPALVPSDATTNGTITGLIGQDGAIGAFISTATGATGYAGGFIAAPTE
ncbi:MAG: hypothetical protein K8953_03940, partial [Proteobacteria bacterium]|nr:hypothetical protein [Pseudomonadota bacterium]